MRSYTLGQTIRISASLLDVNDQVLAPTGMQLLLFGPADSLGVVVPTQIDAADANTLFADVAPATAGVWRYRWEVPSGAKAAREGAFTILPRSVPPPAT